MARPERKLVHIVAVVADASSNGIPREMKIARMEAGARRSPNNICGAARSSSPWTKKTIWDVTPDTAVTARSLEVGQVETCLKNSPT